MFRTGRKVGRTIYHQRADEPADGDYLVGCLDTRELSALAVAGMNMFSVAGHDAVAEHAGRAHGLMVSLVPFGEAGHQVVVDNTGPTRLTRDEAVHALLTAVEQVKEWPR